MSFGYGATTVLRDITFSLRAGETRELELSLIAEKPGKVVNVLTARAEGNLQVQQQVEHRDDDEQSADQVHGGGENREPRRG